MVEVNADSAQILTFHYSFKQQDHKQLLHSVVVDKQLRYGDFFVCQH